MAENQTPVTESNNTNELAVRREKLAALTAAGRNPFELTSFDVNAHSEAIKADFDAYEGKDVQIAGRIIGKRVMGKASFMHLLDRDGKIQVYVKRDDVGTDEYADFKKYDIGDIVGVAGFVFRTQTGEVSVHAKTIVLLSKSLLPLPEKFHGLKDQDLRYRQRYVDLIVNPEVKRNFVIRSQFIKFLRNYLDSMNYIEVETPVLNTIAGGAAARPFITHHNTLDIDMYMRIATELPLKRLIVGGMDRVYEVGRIFRNEGMDPKHNPEFTTVEMYQAYADFHDMMDIAEGILSGAAKAIHGTYTLEWLGESVDLTPGWRRLTMVDAVREYVGIDFGAITDDAEAVAAAKTQGVELAPAQSRRDLLRVDCGDEAQRRRHDAVHLHTLVDHTRDGGLCLTPSCHTHLRQHQVLQTRARAQASHVTRDLLRQLRGGREDDAANALCVEEVSENYVRLMCAQTLDDGEEIRGGLAGAGGSDAEDVTIPDNDGNGLHLNGRGLLVLYS